MLQFLSVAVGSLIQLRCSSQRHKQIILSRSMETADEAKMIPAIIQKYSETSLKWPLSKKTKNWVFKTNDRLMQVKSIAECSRRAFCNTSDMH